MPPKSKINQLKKIVNSDDFDKIPFPAQDMYCKMFVNADKQGCVSGEIWDCMKRMRGASESDVREWRDVLINAGLINLELSGIEYIITVEALRRSNKTPTKPIVENPVSNIPVSELTMLLAERIRANCPKIPVTDKQCISWQSDIRKLMDIDEVPRETIEDAIMFATQDTFWKTVILSAKSLRKHCRQIISRKLSEEEKKSQPQSYIDREMEAWING